MAFFGLFSKKDNKESLDKGLEKTRTNFFSNISKAIVGKSKVDAELLDELEEVLVASDVGIDTTIKIIERLEERVAKDKFVGVEELNNLLKDEISAILLNSETKKDTYTLENMPKPYVMLVVGVNGVGKTTTIGKLAHQYKAAGKKVVLGAADTFRAAAVDQLILWGERVDVPVISHGMNTDPASVAFDAVKAGVDQGADIVIIDTAGRLHTKVNLMNELTKIKRVCEKVLPNAPHEVLLVLDGSTGQNAVVQAREFTKATEVTSLAITKLDGTAKGGVLIGIVDQFKIPVKFIGVGERVEDLQLFDKEMYIESLFSGNENFAK